MNELTVNPDYAELVFPLTELEYTDLKNSILQKGQLVPIIVNQSNTILDGHHRFRICQELSIEPKIVIREDEDPLQEQLFVIDCNLKRRHLNLYQKTTLALKAKPILQKIAIKNQKAGVPLTEISERLGRQGVNEAVGKRAKAGHDTVRKVEIINQEASEKTKGELESGKKSINEVYKAIVIKRKRQKIIMSKPNIELPEGFKLFHGDFREKSRDIPDNSVDLIFTDPPYDRKSLSIYGDLGELAQRILKPGGSLVTFIGTYELLTILDLVLKSGLTYWWIICLKHTGQHSQMFQKKVFPNWKPLLWFVKGEKISEGVESMHDYIESEPPTKVLHEWEQSTVEAEHVIDRLTVENQIVFDPFMGSCTTGLATLNLKRKFIGIEIDEEKFQIAYNRITSEIGSITLVRLPSENEDRLLEHTDGNGEGNVKCIEKKPKK